MPRAVRPSYGRRFAKYYDEIYHELVDYEGDVEFLERVFRRFRGKPKTILDLVCRIGIENIKLARRGYEVTGVDQSREMLALARKKTIPVGQPPRFIMSSVHSFRLR